MIFQRIAVLLHEKKQRNRLMRDAFFITASIAAGIAIKKFGIVNMLFQTTQQMDVIGSIVAGIFFVSIFTAVPAGVILYELAQANSVLLIALLGGFGSLIGDLIIFYFVRNSVAKDLEYIAQQHHQDRLVHIVKQRLFRWMLITLGAIIVASPIPDEIGLALMGISRMKLVHFIPLSFVLNFCGILIIALIAKSMM